MKIIAKTLKMILFSPQNCENNTKNCENNSKKVKQYDKKTQNNTFYLTGINPSRSN